MRERARSRQVELVRGMKSLASQHAVDAETGKDDGCSCSEWVVEMADMIEELHKRIDVLDPDSVR